MAREESAAERANDGASNDAQRSLGGILLDAVTWPVLFITSAWEAITRDGHLAAAGRQGADELGAALKAFPDSVQANEVGTLWSPTQGEIAAGRQHDGQHGGFWTRSYSSLTPPEGWSAAADQHQAGNDHGHDNGHDTGHSM